MSTHPFRARKRFGQHFLTDQGVLSHITQAIAPQQHDHMVEIGPGLGALTHQLLPHLTHLTVVELDRDLAARWHQQALELARKQPAVALTVVQADVLTVDFDELAKAHPIRVVGNLPYNISSPILFHLLASRHRIVDQHFMLQKEVVDRMIAPPNDAAYGRLSVMMQAYYEQTHILHVGPEAFDPPPRVDSAVVRMVPKTDVPAQLRFEVLENVVKLAFSQRRKLLRHTLGAWATAQGFTGDFDFNRRAQEVSPPEYIALALSLAALPLQGAAQ